MYELEGTYPNRKSISSNIIKPIEHSKTLYEAAILSDTGARYGFKICNSMSQDLFAYLFYFNPAKLTVKAWYLSDVVQKGPLHKKQGKAKGEVREGLDGEPAFYFTLPSGMPSDCGYVKLFVSTDYLDLAWIEQKKFPLDFASGIGRMDGHRECFQIRDWDALTVVVRTLEAA
ncbi:DUF2235 domain-containing protein [Mycena venus]|uniref:DUF2235 domain-containing protein n=1 Tax=Mycena venus TaxID=2733690 RepID=A0A8H7D206_9AGAR|nr:DUF2235 domain-containing protein [Mycena venus]